MISESLSRSLYVLEKNPFNPLRLYDERSLLKCLEKRFRGNCFDMMNFVDFGEITIQTLWEASIIVIKYKETVLNIDAVL